VATSHAIKMHCLGQGTNMTPGTNTMFFIPISSIPWATSHLPPHCLCPLAQKAVPHHVHWTTGGHCIIYLGGVSTKTADIITTKLLFNSVVSTLGTQCMMGDLKDFYLALLYHPRTMLTCASPLLTSPLTSWTSSIWLHALTMAMSM